MARNERSRGAGGRTRLPGNDCLAAVAPDLAHTAPEIQARHLRRRFGLSAHLAAAIADLAFTHPDSWQGAR